MRRLARRIDAAQRPSGPMSYEIGSADDPDAAPERDADA